MKFAVTSDLHGSPLQEKDMGVLHDVDTLLIAGDVFEMNRKIKKMTNFFDRIQSEHGVKNIIMTPGNHDHNIFEAHLKSIPTMKAKRAGILTFLAFIRRKCWRITMFAY